ncbi:MAG TPA: alpha/beta fold hydrolase [Thermoanaerobaculia bacterium]|nr:alpha/beta fold hydrolase [Thermoanaerobaculia bacterium]
MPHRPFAPVALAALLTFPAAVRAAAPAGPPWEGKLAACPLPGGNGEALCGTYEVFEDREAHAGRKIPLRIVVLPATGPERAPDPVFFLSGGPGEAATGRAAQRAHSPLRARRDLVLVDVRGTGGSNLLSCPIWGDGTRLDHVFPLDAATACREELRQRADLTRYTTAATVDDLDEVRRYLGYGKVNLVSISYGTYVAQVFLTRHPEAVRSVVLSGVVKPGEPSPLYHSRNAQQALELLARDCAAEPACHAAFPHFREELSAVLDRLGREPVRVLVTNPATGKPVEVRLTRSAAADGLRFALYGPEDANQIPLHIHLAAEGDYRALARGAVQLRAQIQRGLALGLLFSVTCAEDLPRIDPKEIPAATRGTFYGDDRVRDQLAVCAIWPHAPLPPGGGDLVHSDVPALLLSGERDPVTPPADAAQVAKGFPHGLWVQIPHGAHSGAGDCEGRIVAEFVERGAAEGLDVTCLKTAQPVPFVTRNVK